MIERYDWRLQAKILRNEIHDSAYKCLERLGFWINVIFDLFFIFPQATGVQEIICCFWPHAVSLGYKDKTLNPMQMTEWGFAAGFWVVVQKWSQDKMASASRLSLGKSFNNIA